MPPRDRYHVGHPEWGLLDSAARKSEALACAERWATEEPGGDKVTVWDSMARVGCTSAWGWRDGRMQPIGQRIA
jgi:hypothetical protein